MAKAEQKITIERTEEGLEVTVEPIIRKNVAAKWLGDDGVRHYGHTTEKELRALSNMPSDYVLVSLRPNTWTGQDKKGPFIAHQIRGTFAPPHPGSASAEKMINELKLTSPHVPKIHTDTAIGARRMMLEVSVMDPHFGLACFAPAADIDYDLNIARRLYLDAIRKLVSLGRIHGEPEMILFPFGNDFLHAEPSNQGKGSCHTTIGGTMQSEMMSWSHVYAFAEETAIMAIEMLTQVAPVYIPVIPGNHDAYSAYTLGRVLNARFHNNENVTVEASPAPYKFFEYGVNLIGFEHGHNVAPIRLAALMANEAPEAWARTEFREWHIADQHRKGSAKTSTFEEQGVSIEYLPSITSPNDWHRMKAFNRQKRGAMAFLWDYEQGPELRLGINLLGDYSRRVPKMGEGAIIGGM